MLTPLQRPIAPHKLMHVPPLVSEKEAMTIFEYFDPVNIDEPRSKIGLQHKKLCVAVLTMAVDDLNIKHTGSKADNIRNQAAFWFRSVDKSHPFSFLRVCEYLNIDPQYFIRELRPMRRKVYRHIVRATKDMI